MDGGDPLKQKERFCGTAGVDCLDPGQRKCQPRLALSSLSRYLPLPHLSITRTAVSKPHPITLGDESPFVEVDAGDDAGVVEAPLSEEARRVIGQVVAVHPGHCLPREAVPHLQCQHERPSS